MTTPLPAKQFTTVKGHRLARVEAGDGDPMVLLHGIAYMEGIVMPLPSWNDGPEKARGIVQGSPSAKGEDLVLKRNLFLEGVSVLRKLSDEEMAAYRAPFALEADRQPMLNWPRQIPSPASHRTSSRWCSSTPSG